VASSRQRTGTQRENAPARGRAAAAEVTDLTGSDQQRGTESRKLPSVRLAPRDELAGLARVAPLLRASRDLEIWINEKAGLTPGAQLTARTAAAAASALELSTREVRSAWRVAVASRDLPGTGETSPDLASVLADGRTEAVLRVWDAALAVVLESEELDGIATALYTVGGPVGMDGLFDAYASAAGSLADGKARREAVGPGEAAREPRDQGAALSLALETLADLGVVELGTEDADGSLTVALSPLGTWGVHRRLRAQGWHVPVVGVSRQDGAIGLLAALASCDAEDGETEITRWLEAREPAVAAAELIDAADTGTPGQRGAAFAVLDRIGLAARDEIQASLDRPLLRAHSAVWLLEHGEDVQLEPWDRTWLLVDLGAGLLEEAGAQEVVAELLPDLPPEDQAEIVARLWEVSHPGVTAFLTALSDHHPDPAVARAARKAAFKARSPAAATD
jgi:hypothetical protein